MSINGSAGETLTKNRRKGLVGLRREDRASESTHRVLLLRVVCRTTMRPTWRSAAVPPMATGDNVRGEA